MSKDQGKQYHKGTHKIEKTKTVPRPKNLPTQAGIYWREFQNVERPATNLNSVNG